MISYNFFTCIEPLNSLCDRLILLMALILHPSLHPEPYHSHDFADPAIKRMTRWADFTPHVFHLSSGSQACLSLEKLRPTDSYPNI